MQIYKNLLMPRKRKQTEDERLANIIAEEMAEKKGRNVVCIDFSNLHNTFFSHFVICHGTSRVQAEAIADAVEAKVRKEMGQKPSHREGFQNAEWILLDYVDVVAHIFQDKTRQFFKLEELWADAKLNYIESEK